MYRIPFAASTSSIVIIYVISLCSHSDVFFSFARTRQTARFRICRIDGGVALSASRLQDHKRGVVYVSQGRNLVIHTHFSSLVLEMNQIAVRLVDALRICLIVLASHNNSPYTQKGHSNLPKGTRLQNGQPGDVPVPNECDLHGSHGREAERRFEKNDLSSRPK